MNIAWLIIEYEPLNCKYSPQKLCLHFILEIKPLSAIIGNKRDKVQWQGQRTCSDRERCC